jgi:hypothetical protein
MSRAAWCDQGEHAFKLGEPGSQTMSGTEIGEDGISRTIDYDMCAACAGAVKKARSLAIEPAIRG